MLTDTHTQILHQALLQGEPTASRMLVSACSRPLLSLLKRHYPGMPNEIVEDAVTDALLALINHPERYDPQQGSLLNYLMRIGRNKLIDYLRDRKQDENLHFVGGTVELARLEENNYREDRSHPQENDADCLPPAVENLISDILPDPRDRRLWDLICQGRTAVTEYAVVLGITHLPLEQQQAEVKRHRERVQKRIRRRQDAFRSLL